MTTSADPKRKLRASSTLPNLHLHMGRTIQKPAPPPNPSLKFHLQHKSSTGGTECPCVPSPLGPGFCPVPVLPFCRALLGSWLVSYHRSLSWHLLDHRPPWNLCHVQGHSFLLCPVLLLLEMENIAIDLGARKPKTAQSQIQSYIKGLSTLYIYKLN